MQLAADERSGSLQEAMAGGDGEIVEVHESEKVDGLELAVDRRWSADLGADVQVSLQQFGHFHLGQRGFIAAEVIRIDRNGAQTLFYQVGHELAIRGRKAVPACFCNCV